MHSRRPNYNNHEETARYQEYWLNYAIMMKENVDPAADGMQSHVVMQQHMDQLNELRRQQEELQSQRNRRKKRIGLRI